MLYFVALLLICLLQASDGLDNEQETRQSMARLYFEHAVEMLTPPTTSTQLARVHTEVLPLLRAAVRLDPSVASYHAKLGEIELSLGERSSAVLRFLRSISLEPDHLDASKFFEDATNDILDPIRRESSLISQTFFQKFIKIEDLSDNSNFDLRLDRPFLIKNGVKELLLWLIGDKFNTLEFLKKNYPNSNVEVYPQNNHIKPPHRNFRNYKHSLSDVTDFILFPDTAYAKVDASISGTYAHWNTGYDTYREVLAKLNATSEFESVYGLELSKSLFSKCLAETPSLSHEFSIKLHWYMVLMSEMKGSMFFHEDEIALSSWQAQLQGSKAWLVCPPVSSQVESVIEKLQANAVFESSNFELGSLRNNITLFISSLYDILDFHGICPLCSIEDFDYNAAFSKLSQRFSHLNSEISISGESFSSEEQDDTNTHDENGFSNSSGGSDQDAVAISEDRFLSLPPLVRRLLLESGEESSPSRLITCATAVVPPNALIYYPRGYFHQTYNLDTPSVAISSSLLRDEDLPYFLDQMEMECSSPSGGKYGFTSELCTTLMDSCFA